MDQQTAIRLPSPTDAENEAFVTTLAGIVNEAYTAAEGDIFVPSYQRTSATEVAMFIRNGQLAVAYLASNNEPVGCVFVKMMTPERGEFGMFALDAKYQGTGLGRKMITFAEDESRRRGCLMMQVELLVPMTFRHEGKERLLAWYTRLGYKLVKLGKFDEDYPDLVQLLAGPTEYRVFEKSLVSSYR
ncbi:hypothetical protein F66182_5245 [Fusarium sp. NRRL 66182]|nr:hypothetical protein F66182_5245 [Fusarium sp. NRRL 66182]